MSVVVNEILAGHYLDSVALMRIAETVRTQPGVEECGLMMATPANRRILADAAVLAPTSQPAGPGDLIIAIRATNQDLAEKALAEARRQLSKPRGTTGSGERHRHAPRTIASAYAHFPTANLVLISVPGTFAAAEAAKAIGAGLSVMMFSDNVAIEDEVALKRQAAENGVLLMGPDCGTAIIGGVPLAFANEVARGDIAIIGASGTGIQEVTTLISNAGGGISHAIGTGGRDLSREVGALTTLAAIDLLDADPATRHIVLISKPPAVEVARRVLARVAQSAKPFTICFLGTSDLQVPANARLAGTLEDAALLAMGKVPQVHALAALAKDSATIRGLFSGGTLAAEAQVILRQAGVAVASNAPIAGAKPTPDSAAGGHVIIDLGDDAFTVGRPHPMIEPAIRDTFLDQALDDPACAVVLLDCVIGHGSHPDPAGHLARHLQSRASRGATVIASVTGTDRDPQQRAVQMSRLAAAGIEVAESNAAATRLALTRLGQSRRRKAP